MKKNRNSTLQEIHRKLILASSSPRRKELLKQLGLSFRVIPSNIEEKLNPRHKPSRQAEELSIQKARAISKKHKDAIIIAADTLVVIDNEILGKPIDFREAKRFLRKLSGRDHNVITGFTILDMKTSKRVTRSIITKVTMKKLTQSEIDNYIIQVDPTDKAGGYGIQGIGGVLFEKIDGDYSNILGLPLFHIYQELKKFGIRIL